MSLNPNRKRLDCRWANVASISTWQPHKRVAGSDKSNAQDHLEGRAAGAVHGCSIAFLLIELPRPKGHLKSRVATLMKGAAERLSAYASRPWVVQVRSEWRCPCVVRAWVIFEGLGWRRGGDPGASCGQGNTDMMISIIELGTI